MATNEIRTITVDGRTVTSMDLFYDLIFTHLELPSHFGRNLDALWECLTTEVAGPVRVIWVHSEVSRKSIGSKFQTLIEMLVQDLPEERPDIEFIFR